IAAHAQQASKAARIGYLAFRSPISADDAFLKGLFELGWVEGQNIVIERRFAVGNAEHLKGSAAELVRLKVDVIVTAASAPTKVAKEATASIPIVFANAGDPVGQGFVQSLPRPRGNVTGIAFDASPDITAKQAQLLIELVPTVSRLAVLWNPTSAFLHFLLERHKNRSADAAREPPIPGSKGRQRIRACIRLHDSCACRRADRPFGYIRHFSPRETRRACGKAPAANHLRP